MDKDRNHDRKKRKHDGDESAWISLNQHGKRLRQSYQVGNPAFCEDVLRTIISHMNMKDAARISLLSSRWKRVSSSPLDLCFTGETVLREYFKDYLFDILCDDSLTNLQKRIILRRRSNSFLKNVDKYLERFATTSRSGINKFELRFCFYYRIPYVGSYLDKWIQIATAHTPRELIIDLWNLAYFQVDPGTNRMKWPFYLSSQLYILPCHLFMDIPLERLFLRFSALQLPSNFKGFKLLKRLDLRKMKVTQEDFNDVVSGCHRLEELRVEKCWDLKYLKLSLTSTIKHLVVRSWKRLRKITLSSKCIMSFEYTGRPIIFTTDAPLLSRILFCFKPKRGSDGVKYLFTRSYHDFPQMKTLFLEDIPRIAPDFLPPSGKFAKLKRLFVNIPESTKVDLLLLSHVLNESPQLETFHLCVFSFPGLNEDSNYEIRRPPMCPHNSIREFQTNFVHLFNQLELMIYIVDNAIKLETIIIDRDPVYYEGDHKWIRHKSWNHGDEDIVMVPNGDREVVHTDEIAALVIRTSSAYHKFLLSIPQSVNLIKR